MVQKVISYLLRRELVHLQAQRGDKRRYVVLPLKQDPEALRSEINAASRKVLKGGAIVVQGIGLKDQSEAWRAWIGLKSKYPAVKTLFDVFTGVGVIFPEGKRLAGEYEDLKIKEADYKAARMALMGKRMPVKWRKG